MEIHHRMPLLGLPTLWHRLATHLTHKKSISQLWEARGKRKPSLHRCELWSISTPAFLTQSVSDNYKLVTRHRSQHTGLLATKRTGRWEYIRRAVNQPAHRFATREGMVRDKNRDAISEQPLKVSAKRSTSVPEQRRDGWHCFLEKWANQQNRRMGSQLAEGKSDNRQRETNIT